jgi:PmbA protein
MIRENNSFSVTVRMGEVETLKEAISRRSHAPCFLRPKNSDLSYLRSHAIRSFNSWLMKQVQMAKLTSEDQSAGLPEPAVRRNGFADLRLLDSSWELLTPAERIDLAVRAERAALDADPAITNSEGASFDYTRTQVALGNTQGFTARTRERPPVLLCSDCAVGGWNATRSLDVCIQTQGPDGIAGGDRQEGCSPRCAAPGRA